MFTEQYDCPLLAHNTFGVEAKAYCLLTYASEDELKAALAHVGQQHTGRPLLHIGGGSNLLFLSDYEGVLLHSAIHTVEVTGQTEEHVFLRVGAGVVWDDFVEYCVENHYYGVENLSLIPGEVGAAAVQNIGAYGAEAKDVIETVETISMEDASKHVFTNADCAYGYRKSFFKTGEGRQYAVTYVNFKLNRLFIPNMAYGGIRSVLEEKGISSDEVTAADVRRAVIGIRRSKLPDPCELGNAGSFFMNPVVGRDVYERLSAKWHDMPYYILENGQVKIPAGWLIEQCGWKGRPLGRAAVHDKQALVLVNKGGATGRDILALCEAVRSDVRQKFGIDLRPEVNIIGGTVK